MYVDFLSRFFFRSITFALRMCECICVVCAYLCVRALSFKPNVRGIFLFCFLHWLRLVSATEYNSANLVHFLSYMSQYKHIHVYFAFVHLLQLSLYAFTNCVCVVFFSFLNFITMNSSSNSFFLSLWQKQLYVRKSKQTIRKWMRSMTTRFHMIAFNC